MADNDEQERNDDPSQRMWRHIGDLETRVTVMEGTVQRLDNDFYNHGRDGLLTKFNGFITEFRTTEKNRETFQNLRDQELKDAVQARHLENQEKLNEVSAQVGRKTLIWNIAGVLVGIAAVVVAICFGILTAKAAHMTDLERLIGPKSSMTIFAFQKGPAQDSQIYVPR